MKYVVSIDTDNAAFVDAGPHHEVARILEELARRLRFQSEVLEEETLLRDLNGNTIGRAGPK